MKKLVIEEKGEGLMKLLGEREQELEINRRDLSACR